MIVVRYIIIGLAWLLVAFGLSSFFFGLLCAGGAFANLETYEFPLGDPTGIVVDDEGRIYCALQFYHRIQVYNSQGQFIQNWHIASPGNFSFRIHTQEHKILVELSDGAIVFFSTDGKLILEPPAQNIDDMVQASTFCFDAIGDCYEIKNRLWNPHIVKITSGAPEQILVKMTWYQLLISGPLIPWLEILLGFILLGILQILEEKIPGFQPTKISTSSQTAKKINLPSDTILIPMTYYLFLEPLAIILGSCIAIAILLYLEAVGFLQTAFTVVIVIVGMHALLHSIFSPRCPSHDCHGEIYKLGDKPLRYRCRVCGTIYTQDIVEF